MRGSLNERGRRLFAATEALAIGRGGVALVARATGMAPSTIGAGKAEVRAIALSQLDIHPGEVVWDIGAGSGSVAIECAQLAQPGTVYAIEQDAADYHLILANAEAFGVRNLRAIHGTAPGVFAGLPAPGNDIMRTRHTWPM